MSAYAKLELGEVFYYVRWEVLDNTRKSEPLSQLRLMQIADFAFCRVTSEILKCRCTTEQLLDAVTGLNQK